MQYEFVKAVNELTNIWHFRDFIPPQILNELIHDVSRNLRYTVGKNPSTAIEYIKLLKNLGEQRLLREHISKDFIQEILEISFSELRHKENLILQYEFIKAVNELTNVWHLRSFAPPQILNELIHDVSRNLRYTVRENPFAFIEYLKLTANLGEQRLLREHISKGFIQEIFEIILYEIRHREDSILRYEFIKVVNKLMSLGYFREFVPPQILDELIYSVNQDLKYITKDNPATVIEYLKFLNNLGKVELILEHFPQLNTIHYKNYQDVSRQLETFINIFFNETRN
ncbi:hypothetical protein [Runella slithyformis]|uniref:Uncharacterized protein n=1 Tax=Runella slithyformis (strain ATCC 29530 / DSM 19594 / LMG 11500 / NCIMB 11436 / LSU 4) TaxID=761193 RepID=A0A7U4E436_RUNSL|nr:hypothetical protein [Runella slithyformis]AEI47081.1 hypothetical protein Runsl_0638 [Runella slithyformis DSM 19594]